MKKLDLKDVQEADKIIMAAYELGRAQGHVAARHMLTQLALLFALVGDGLYESFPTADAFIKFMHDDPRVQQALRDGQ